MCVCVCVCEALRLWEEEGCPSWEPDIRLGGAAGAPSSPDPTPALLAFLSAPHRLRAGWRLAGNPRTPVLCHPEQLPERLAALPWTAEK